MEVTFSFSQSSVLNSILGAIFLIALQGVIIDAQAPVLSANSSKGTEGSPLKLVCTLSATAASVKWWRTEKTDTTQTEVNVVTVGILSGICTPSPDPPPDNLVTTCSSLVYGCTIPSLNTTSDGDVWRCSIAIGMVTTHSNTLQISVTASTPEECTNCCCCKDKWKKDVPCGIFLAVCILVMAVLGYVCYTAFASNNFFGKTLLICAIAIILLVILALSGVIINAFSLSKECCSCSDVNCKENNCFPDYTIAGIVLAGISLVGSFLVGVPIIKKA